MSVSSKQAVFIGGASIGLRGLTNLVFDANRPFAGCRICGTCYQSEYDRNPVEQFREERAVFDSMELLLEYAASLRKEWSHNHARKHTEKEHADLAASGLWCTPEAAQKMAAYGVINLVDLVMNPEVEAAYRESSAVPTDDVEGT